ncbi:AF4/FMR2 family member 3 [Periophthalmus magnuspinnatus]|uniref:AF4/FMR2 family member 3 n=1 Tax=Periophthalmus magnuspinnatus TaxID=409849 RepID=UPI00243727F2|nr:AF4/FMR2 family member 3 [Periophthalmus magnuspinnatus]
MTQSWISQQTLGGENTQRILYKPKDVTQPPTHLRQSGHLGDAQLRMTRHPHVAPHKSMLADDLKLSSDEEDFQTVNHEPAWDGHSRTAQISHGRRVRHSSSESSDSNSSVGSSSSSLHSQSSSPKTRPETVSPTTAQDPCSSKEIGQPSAAHWQLDKWWRKARKKSSSGEQDPSENIPGYPPSPYAQKAPSPARSWDSNQEYSPCQSPISIPHFNYRLTRSPSVPSPGYQSPVPNISPGSIPRPSPVPSPVLSVCPSPCGSPRASQLSPLPKDPPRSPSPTLPSTHHQQHPGNHSHLRPATQVKKIRTWNNHLPNTENTKRNKTSTEQLHKSKHKFRHTQEQNHSRAKTDTISSHNHKAPSNYFSSSKQASDISKSKPTTIQQANSKSSHKPSFQLNSHINCETNNKTDHSSHPQHTTNKNLNSKTRPASTATFVQDLKRPLRKSESKEQYNEHVDIENRQHERKKHSIEENQQGKREKRESRRLAEEQLRQPWIQSSEEDYEEEALAERRGPREEREHRKREQKQKHEWHTAQVNPKPPTSHHCLQEQKDKTKKGRTTISLRGSPAPPSPSPSSTWSSSADSEYQAPITKVPADSTSQKPVHGRARDPTRSDVNRSKSAPLRIGIPCEKQQSECRQKLYTLVPFGRGEKSAASSQRGLGNLVVQIDLCLLKRVPDSTTLPPAKKPPSHVSSATKDKQREAMRHLYVPDGKRKRKMENGVSHRESKRGVTYANESSGPAADNHILTETTHSGPINEYLDSKRPLSPLSPVSPDSPEFIKPSSQVKTSEKNRDKKRDVAIKPKMEVESLKCPQSTKPPTESWGPSGHRGAVTLPEIQHHAEYYLHEAKRMKHRADAMVDKLGKAVNYVDAALSFMECGKAMEQGPLEAKSPYTMYAETVELIRYAMRLKSHSGPGARQEDKQLAVLCFRCLALLYWQMFRLKKDHALKYSKVLLDYFKTSPKVPASAPCWNGSGKSPGGHPLSLSPNAKNRSWSSHGGNSSSFINIPHRIHQMAANHLNITNSVLYSYEYWEVADNLAKDNIEFFNYLNTLSGPLTLHSSIAHAVQYTRQALQWIRISAKLN